MPFGKNYYKWNTQSQVPGKMVTLTTTYFTKEFVNYLSNFKKPITVDLITCDLNSGPFLAELSTIKEKLPNITFNYSTNNTGNLTNADWKLESSTSSVNSQGPGIDLEPIYFNNIKNWQHILGVDSTTPIQNFEYSSERTNPAVHKFTLTRPFTISDDNPWTKIDITNGNSTDKIIIDGAGHLITVLTDNFDGMFIAGNSDNNDYATEFINFNFHLTAPEVETLLMQTKDYVKINNCKAFVTSNIVNSGGIFGKSLDTTGIKKITITNSYCILNGDIRDTYAGCLIGQFHGGGSCEVDSCYVILNGDIADYGGAFIGGQIGYNNGNKLKITNSYCVFNGKLGINSGIFFGSQGGGNGGEVELTNNIVIANISNINNNGYYVSTQECIPTGTRNYIFDLTGKRTNVISNGADLVSKFEKSNTYASFIRDINKNLIKSTDKFDTEKYKINYDGVEMEFPKLKNMDSYTITINNEPKYFTYFNRTLTDYFVTSPVIYSSKPFKPSEPTPSAGSGTITYSSSDTTIASVDSETGFITMLSSGNVTITATISADGKYTKASASINLKIINSNIVSTGSDPIIQPLFGPKFGLAQHIKYVNLLADYSNNIFINGQVGMLNPADFPRDIYWDNGFSKISDLSHVYDNSYYRKFHITCGNETIEIDADTLKVHELTPLNKLRIVNFKPKTGIRSISFDKLYPLTSATKGIRIGFLNYLLTIVSDINTDDRHHLELLHVKNFDNPNLSGALISKDQIIRISNLAGSELYELKPNPFDNFYSIK